MKIKLLSMVFLSFLSAPAMAEDLVALSVEQLQAMQRDAGALVIDIRTDKEWQTTGVIPGSHTMEFFGADGKYDAHKWLTDLSTLKSAPEQPVILVCRSGNRSGRLGNCLTQQLGMKNVYHLSDGIESWIQAGGKLDAPCLNQTACN